MQRTSSTTLVVVEARLSIGSLLVRLCSLLALWTGRGFELLTETFEGFNCNSIW